MRIDETGRNAGGLEFALADCRANSAIRPSSRTRSTCCFGGSSVPSYRTPARTIIVPLFAAAVAGRPSALTNRQISKAAYAVDHELHRDCRNDDSHDSSDRVHSGFAKPRVSVCAPRMKP